jgi:hypothetical protein
MCTVIMLGWLVAFCPAWTVAFILLVGKYYTLCFVVRVLSFWCFSAGFAMAHLQNLGVRSIILTSGTLKPLFSLSAELCM